MDIYTTKDGDLVDLIAFKRYGRHQGTTELIYDANPGLSKNPIILPAGLEIKLPPLPTEKPHRTMKLYD